MPLERVSRGFKDVSMSFQVNPLTYDLITISNETAIARSIRNLILTQTGERFFNEELGSEIKRALFNNMDIISADAVKSQISTVINAYEPRVELIEVLVEPDFDNNTFNVSISYRIIGIDVLPQQLSFALQAVR
jgi:phage baseplate assembly protein W